MIDRKSGQAGQTHLSRLGRSLWAVFLPRHPPGLNNNTTTTTTTTDTTTFSRMADITSTDMNVVWREKNILTAELEVFSIFADLKDITDIWRAREVKSVPLLPLPSSPSLPPPPPPSSQYAIHRPPTRPPAARNHWLFVLEPQIFSR